MLKQSSSGTSYKEVFHCLTSKYWRVHCGLVTTKHLSFVYQFHQWIYHCSLKCVVMIAVILGTKERNILLVMEGGYAIIV